MQMENCTGENIDCQMVSVAVGDTVCFKSDIEQSGEIIKIEPWGCKDYRLTLRANDRFEGGYIAGQSTTWIHLSETWS